MTASEGDLQGLSVLVVDDEEDTRELIRYLLCTSGAEVHVADGAQAALHVLEAHTPDVIVSDIGMPGEDGYALLRSIRALPAAEKKSIPAIALTAFARNLDRARALVAGFNVHIPKPVEPSLLVSAVRELARSEPSPLRQ